MNSPLHGVVWVNNILITRTTDGTLRCQNSEPNSIAAFKIVQQSPDQVPHQAPNSVGSLLLPLTFSPFMLSLTLSLINKIFFKKILFIYLRDCEREHERGEGQREKQTPLGAGSPIRDSILGLHLGTPDHDLRRRQLLNQWSHPGTLNKIFKK